MQNAEGNVGSDRLHSAFGISHYRGAAVLVLAALFLAAHLASLPASLEDLDSINFAFGVQHFDVAHHHPHPPGYPLFILIAKAARLVSASEAHALAVVAAVAGALSIFALVALFRRIDPDRCAPASALIATLLTVTAPLYWFAGSRPLSDLAGLAAAIGVQALTLAAATPASLAIAAFLAGFATGLRSQVAWLTVPLIVLAIVRLRRRGTAPFSAAAFAVGGLLWGVPLVVLTGPRAYWHAIFDQGAEDLTGVQMLWTTPTGHQLVAALHREFVAPWSVTLVAAIVFALAVAGAVRMFRVSRGPLLTLAAAFVPYLAFDLLFQETVTTRYALPMLVPTAYLAMRGLAASADAGPLRPRLVVAALGLAMFNVQIAGTSLAGYSSVAAPAFRLLSDMRELSASAASSAAKSPVVATHRRESLDLRGPLAWSGGAIPGVRQWLPAPPQHEWLELVKYWNGGGRDEVWFVTDPARTDVALIDHASARAMAYRWPFQHHELIGGVRPDVMDWLRIRQPGWYLGEGWALTPETAGIAAADGRGPDRAPIEGWIRRRHDALTLMIGGRNLAPAGVLAHVTVAIDGRAIAEPVVASGFFLRMIALPPGALDGAGDFATVSVAANARVAVEQFDAQSSDRVVFGFGEGWHEAEFSEALGLWRWTSDRAVLRVHAAGRSLMLTLRGEAPIVSHWRPAHVTVRAGGRVVADEMLITRFDLQIRIPAVLVAGDDADITIETDRTSVPAEGIRRSADRRRLGLRVFECEVRPIPTR
jgi:hypothetical protein